MGDVRAVAQQLGLNGFAEMLTFIALLFLGYGYACQKGALQWV